MLVTASAASDDHAQIPLGKRAHVVYKTVDGPRDTAPKNKDDADENDRGSADQHQEQIAVGRRSGGDIIDGDAGGNDPLPLRIGH